MYQIRIAGPHGHSISFVGTNTALQGELVRVLGFQQGEYSLSTGEISGTIQHDQETRGYANVAITTGPKRLVMRLENMATPIQQGGVQAIEQLDAEIIVVDNNSVDGSLKMINHKFPKVIVIPNKTNTGFSVANNQGINIAKGKHILLLNPDTVVQEDTLLKCVKFLDTNKNAGALGIKMFNGKGEFLPESKRGLPTPRVAFFKIFGSVVYTP